MATKEEGSEPLHDKTRVLRVFIHCEGCKKKVRRILKSVPGVITTEIDSRQNKVTVTGDVEADTLIRKLSKSGKHAELWPMEKKPSSPIPNPNPSVKEKSKEKGKEVVEKERDASRSNEPTDKPEKNPEKSAATSSGTDTKPAPAESDTKPAENSSKEVSKPDPKPATTSSESETKPADTATKSGGSGKKKSKNKGVEETAGDDEEVFVMNSSGGPQMHQQPLYPQPVYGASYNMVHPAASYSHYALMPPQPQSYMYSGHPPPPYMYPNHPPPPDYYTHYPSENYYAPENYYEHAPPPPPSLQSQGSYDFFSDENANSCNVM